MTQTRPLSYQSLEAIAREIRFRTIRNSHLSGTPHLGSCLSCTDILVWLYWNVLRVDPENPSVIERDRFVLSKGHAAPVLFQVLAESGFFSKELLETYGQDGSLFGEHPPTPSHLPGVEAATGSLGHGLPMALGMAIAARIQGHSYDVYAVLSDGECNEGSVWEAALMAAAQRVSNLTIFIDYNKWQATGRSNEVLGLAPLEEKWRAFGWATVEIDGHSFQEMTQALKSLSQESRPKAFICNTVKGKGIPFMEDDNNWHYRIPTADEVVQCAQLLGIASDCIAIEGRTPISHG
ncbi:MAG: transketolase [Burkholderiaceae bacterium]|nr:transketolase [Burkholderiaceae bacterium]